MKHLNIKRIIKREMKVTIPIICFYFMLYFNRKQIYELLTSQMPYLSMLFFTISIMFFITTIIILVIRIKYSIIGNDEKKADSEMRKPFVNMIKYAIFLLAVAFLIVTPIFLAEVWIKWLWDKLHSIYFIIPYIDLLKSIVAILFFLPILWFFRNVIAKHITFKKSKK